MLTLEEFLSARKAEDGIEEQNIAQYTRNKRLCIKYVEEYFDQIVRNKAQECSHGTTEESNNALLEDVLDNRIHNALKRFFNLHNFTGIKTLRDFKNNFSIDLDQQRLVCNFTPGSSYKVRDLGELSLEKLHNIVTNTKLDGL